MLVVVVLFLIFTQPSFAVDPIVKITNFSSNSSPEWVEVYNQTDTIIDLTGWAIGDSNTQVLYDLPLTGCLSPNTYQTFFHDSGWLNDDGDTIYLYNSQPTLIDSFIYTDGKYDPNYRSTNTCTPTPPVPTSSPTPIPTVIPTNTPLPLPTITPSPTNIPTIINTPAVTNTPGPTNTPTATKTPAPTNIPTATKTLTPTKKPTLTPSVTEEKIIETIVDESFQTPTPAPVLGISDIITPSPTINPPRQPADISKFIPTIFITVGGLLLLSPLAITALSKIRQKY